MVVVSDTRADRTISSSKLPGTRIGACGGSGACDGWA